MSKAQIQKLADRINYHRDLYYNHEPEISDVEFDGLIDELTELDPNNEAITSIGAEAVSNEWKKEKHLHFLGSLNKVNTPEAIADWIDEYCKGSKIFLVTKLDGLSVGLAYENGELVAGRLRGGGESGENITTNLVKMKGVKTSLSDNFTGTLRGEIVLTKTDHQKHFPDYANPRNAASGISRRLEGDGSEHLTVMFYQAMGNIDFTTEQEQFRFLEKNRLIVPVSYLLSETKQVLDIYAEYQDHFREEMDVEIDGFVMSCNNLSQQKAAGETHHRPKGKMAIKFPNQGASTILEDVIWECGKQGRVTPVAICQPVDVMGVEVKRASLYNIGRIKTLDLKIGAKVLVCRAGDVVPRLERIEKNGDREIIIPIHCPTCNTDLIMQGENLHCPNYSCQAQIEGRIRNWITTLDILEWGGKLIERLVEEKLVENIADLYTLTVDDLAALERMGQKSAEKCHSLLWQKNPIPLAQFIGGLSIPMVAVSTVEMLIAAGYDTLDKILELPLEKITMIKGMGEVKATSLFDGLRKNKNIIERLLEMKLSIQAPIIEAKEIFDGPLNGMKICITGKTEIKRDILHEMIYDAGGEFLSSITAACTHLVMADVNSKSSKAVKAKKNGIALMSEDDLLELIGVL